MAKRKRYCLGRSLDDQYALNDDSAEWCGSYFRKNHIGTFCGPEFRAVTDLRKSDLRPGQCKEVEITVRVK